jgi:hypothetical protein
VESPSGQEARASFGGVMWALVFTQVTDVLISKVPELEILRDSVQSGLISLQGVSERYAKISLDEAYQYITMGFEIDFYYRMTDGGCCQKHSGGSNREVKATR